jgi:hypothetical protein
MAAGACAAADRRGRMAGAIRGLAERADLLERIVADIYGREHAGGARPAAARLIAGKPGIPAAAGRRRAGRRPFPAFLRLRARPRPGRPLVGAGRPHAGAVGRRLRAGEPRRHDARASRHLRRHHVPSARRLLPALPRRAGAADEPPDRVAILTPGPLNETYFEHAYIARYLGIMLLEGEDLTVADGRLMVRTVSGLKPVSVLWRRSTRRSPIRSSSIRDSHIGTPGLVEALRPARSQWSTRSAPASSRRARCSPSCRRIARALNGCDLKLPSVATWWCGQPPSAACHRQSRPDGDRPGAVDAPALRGRQRDIVLGSRCKAKARAPVCSPGSNADGALRRPGGGHAVDDAGLRKRPAVAAAGGSARLCRPHRDGWTIMPGGFARIGSYARPDRHRHAARRPGGRRLGRQRPAGRAGHAAAGESDWVPTQRCRAACPAAPPKT